MLVLSSAFNTIVPDLLLDKLTQLSVPTSVCQWIISFLTDRQQLVRLGQYTSSTRTISTGAPQGCVLSQLLFSLYTNDCTSKDPSVKLLKFSDDTRDISPINDGDESAYRQEVKELAAWCSLNKTAPGAKHSQKCGDSGLQEKPPCSDDNFSGPEVGRSHWLYRKKDPAEAVFPSPAKEVQSATRSRWNSSTLPSSSLSCVHL